MYYDINDEDYLKECRKFANNVINILSDFSLDDNQMIRKILNDLFKDAHTMKAKYPKLSNKYDQNVGNFS